MPPKKTNKTKPTTKTQSPWMKFLLAYKAKHRLTLGEAMKQASPIYKAQK